MKRLMGKLQGRMSAFILLVVLSCVSFTPTVLFAEASRQSQPHSFAYSSLLLVSLISWNVWFDNASGNVRFPKIVDQIDTIDASIVFLQEVTPAFIDQLHQTRNMDRYQLHITPNAQRSYSLAVLSQWPVIKQRVYRLPSQYRRTAYFLLMRLPDNSGMMVINVHLESGQFEASARARQIQAIVHQYLPDFVAEIRADYPELLPVMTVWAGGGF